MKKLLLVSTAIAGVAFLATPAHAALKMDLGGYFDGYVVYADNHEVGGAGAGLRNYDLRRDTEVHVNGETTLDNGLTVGAHTELRVGNNDLPGTANAGSTTVTTDEVYGYASGGWGRVNLGQEDGAAYLLQVAAPSADSNVDGLRTYIQALNPTAGTQATGNTAVGGAGNGLSALLGGGAGSVNAFSGAVTGGLDYQQADFRQTDRVSYLTPKFDGFQAGASYATHNGLTSATGPMGVDNTAQAGGASKAGANVAAAFKNLWEVGARWDGEFQGVGVNLGGGYSDSSLNGTEATVANIAAQGNFVDDASLTDGVKSYNGGLNLSYAGFSLGGDYRHSKTSQIASTTNVAVVAGDIGSGNIVGKTWDVGLGYDNGPYHVGASYLHDRTRLDAIQGVDTTLNAETYTEHRYALGAGYTYGPGMTFRGSVAWGKFTSSGATGANADTASFDQGLNDSNKFTQVAVGTDIQF